MLDTIIYTSGIIFVALLFAYLHINNKTNFAFKSFTSIFLRKTNAINFYLKSHAYFFKNRQVHEPRTIAFALVLTLIVAFVLYNYVFFTVPVSDSMRPTFESGDLVLMQKIYTEPHEGDILMFGMAVLGKPNSIITHRAVSVTPKGVKTKGDATPLDSWVIPKERIYAKAVTIGGKPIVVKSVGHYFLDTKITSTYAREFAFMQTIFKGGKRLGLLIFVICIVAYVWISVNDMKKQNKYRRRN